MENSADVQMEFGLVQNADVDQLLAGAAVFDEIFCRNVAAGVWFKGIEGTFGLKE